MNKALQFEISDADHHRNQIAHFHS